MKIIWSPKATNALYEIGFYISKDSKIHAQKLLDELIIKSENIIHFPTAGRVVPEFDNDKIRELIIRDNYRLIYQIAETEILILLIRHVKQKLTKRNLN